MDYTPKQIDNFRRAKRYLAYCAGTIAVSGIEKISSKEIEIAKKISHVLPRKIYDSEFIRHYMEIIKNG